MRIFLSTLLTLLFIGIQTTLGQDIIASPKSNAITVVKVGGSDLLIPLEFDIVNSRSNTSTPIITIQIDNTTAPVLSQFNPTDIAKVKIINNNQTLSISAYETKKPSNTFYLFIDRSVSFIYDKTIYLKINDHSNQLSTIKVTIQPETIILTLEDYLEKRKRVSNRVNRLDYVTKVESSNNLLTVSGYKRIPVNNGAKQDVFIKRNVELKRNEVLAITEWSWIFNFYHWKPIPISLTTIPFKVRSKTTFNGKEFSGSASSGITNLGFNLDLGKYQKDRYFSTGKKSTHKFSLGMWTAPSVEELDSTYTNGANGELGKAAGKLEKSKQLFISGGITLSYTYNDISFVLVPAGWDFATTTIGKTWVYNKQWWWGFGIAVNPKIFSTILNK